MELNWRSILTHPVYHPGYDAHTKSSSHTCGKCSICSMTIKSTRTIRVQMSKYKMYNIYMYIFKEKAIQYAVHIHHSEQTVDHALVAGLW